MNDILSNDDYKILESNFIIPIVYNYKKSFMVKNIEKTNLSINPQEIYINNNKTKYSIFGKFLKDTKSFWHSNDSSDKLIISINKLNYAFNYRYQLLIKNRILNISIHMSCNINDKEQCENILDKSVKRINTMFAIYIDNLYYNNIEKNDYTFIFLYNDIDRSLITNETDYKKKVKDLYFNHSFYTTAGWNMFSMTSSTSVHNYMVVTRKSGFLGLLVHELCHCCNLDGIVKGYEIKEYHTLFNRIINKNINSGLFIEGLNNALSSIIHSIFISVESNMIISFRESLSNEIVHSYKQVYKLLRFFDCRTINELIKKQNYFNVNDSVFEYVILRGIYFKYLNHLLHYPYKEGINSYYKKFLKCFNNSLNILWDKDDTKTMNYYYYN